MPLTRVLIPFCQTDEWRKKALDYVIKSWHDLGHGVSVSHEGSPSKWSKGRAVASAAAIWPEAEILIIADADCVVEEGSFTEVLSRVADGFHGWGTPYNRILRFTQDATERIYTGRGTNGPEDLLLPPYSAVHGGGVTVLTRSAWERVRGIDPRFTGWGGEDLAFGWALGTLVGPGAEVDGHVRHLWHPEQGPKRPVSRETMRLLARYRRARGRPDRMAALVAEIPLS